MIRIAKHSDIGGRDANEDSLLVTNTDNYIVCVMGDGLGGQGRGEEASALVTEGIAELCNSQIELSPSVIKSALTEVNAQIIGLRDGLQRPMSTAVILCLNDNQAFWAHVGDSRLYHFIEGHISFMTQDHSVSQMAVFAGEIGPEEIRGHADRSKLLRALGRSETLRSDCTDIVDISKGSHAFLLCTDGFWEYILEEEMEELLEKASSPKEWLLSMKMLLEERTESIDNDNNSAIVVWIENQ